MYIHPLTQRAIALVVVALSLVLAVSPAGAATHTMTKRAVVKALHLAASPTKLSYHGGVVTLTSPAGRGGTCILSSFPRVKGFPTHPNCARSMRYHATIPMNTSGVAKAYVFSLNSSRTSIRVAANPSVAPPVAAVAPVITVEPTAAIISGFVPGKSPTTYSPSSATFVAAASGTPTPSVQWYFEITNNSVWVQVPGGTSPTLAITPTLSSEGWTYKAVFSNSAGTASTTPAVLETISYNTAWSGYVDAAPTGQQFTSTTGTFVVPQPTCSSAETWAGIWGGLDMATVEQAGVFIHCSGGAPTYEAFYEYYGDVGLNAGSAVALTNSYPVAAGDSITVTISFSGGAYTFALNDTTARWNFETSTPEQATPAVRKSAEWIVEAPQTCSSAKVCATTSAPYLSPVVFSNATATTSAGVTGPLSNFSPAAMGLLDITTGAQMNYPSLWDVSGSSFTMTSATPTS